MYMNIVDPVTGKKHKTNSTTGKFIVNSYLQQVGGKLIGTGTYKCAVRPPIKCGATDDDDETLAPWDVDPLNYVSLITTEDEAAAEKDDQKKGRDVTQIIPSLTACGGAAGALCACFLCCWPRDVALPRLVSTGARRISTQTTMRTT